MKQNNLDNNKYVQSRCKGNESIVWHVANVIVSVGIRNLLYNMCRRMHTYLKLLWDIQRSDKNSKLVSCSQFILLVLFYFHFFIFFIYLIYCFYHYAECLIIVSDKYAFSGTYYNSEINIVSVIICHIFTFCSDYKANIIII
jgi:hypothetical protein